MYNKYSAVTSGKTHTALPPRGGQFFLATSYKGNGDGRDARPSIAIKIGGQESPRHTRQLQPLVLPQLMHL